MVTGVAESFRAIAINVSVPPPWYFGHCSSVVKPLTGSRMNAAHAFMNRLAVCDSAGVFGTLVMFCAVPKIMAVSDPCQAPEPGYNSKSSQAPKYLYLQTGTEWFALAVAAKCDGHVATDSCTRSHRVWLFNTACPSGEAAASSRKKPGS